MANVTDEEPDFSGNDRGTVDPDEMPRTRWPTIAGVALIISMILLFLTGAIFYLSAERVDEMAGDGPVVGIVHERLESKDYPVKDVNVSIEGSDLWTYTDGEGYYKFPKVPAGIQHIKFSKAGYKIIILKVIIIPDTETQFDEETTNNFSFPSNIRGGVKVNSFKRDIEHRTLSLDSGTLNIAVKNETGASMSNLNVSYLTSEDADSSQPVTPFRKKTDGNGMLSLNLTPNKYIFNYTLPGYRTVNQEVLVKPGKVSYSNITMFAGVGVEEFRLTQKITITGTIETDEGEPIENALVRIAGTDISTMTNMGGEFRLENISVGQQVLSITKVGYSAISTEIFVCVNTSADFNLKYLGEKLIDNSDVSMYYYCAMTYVVIAFILLFGAFLAFKRRNYGVPLFASLIGLIASVYIVLYNNCIAAILCIVALVAVFISRREFH